MCGTNKGERCVDTVNNTLSGVCAVYIFYINTRRWNEMTAML